MRWIVENDELRLGVEVVGTLDNNVYVVACQKTRAAVIIDAAASPSAIIEGVAGYTPSEILTTHGHWDHIGAVDEVANHFGIDFRMHLSDEGIAQRPPNRPLFDGEIISVGDLEIGVLHTPGHTPGSVCFAAPGMLLTGDTLFPGGPGATRFPYSDFSTIMHSLTERLFTFPDDTSFFPGHGAASTIGAERPAVEEWRRRGW